MLSIPIAAQLGVLPVSLAVFGSVSLAAIPANLLAEPLAGPVTVVGLITALLGGLIHPWLPDVAAWLQYPTAGLLGAIDLVARVAARHPLAVDGRALLGLLALGCAGWAARMHLRRATVPPQPPGTAPLTSAAAARRINADHLHSHH